MDLGEGGGVFHIVAQKSKLVFFPFFLARQGPEGTTFSITTFFSVSNSTGLEQLSFQISGGEIASGQSEVLLNLKDGAEYSVQLTVQVSTRVRRPCSSRSLKRSLILMGGRVCVKRQAVNDEQAQPPVEWLPGPYSVDIALCKGACDDSKPWSGIQDTASTTFTISG